MRCVKDRVISTSLYYLSSLESRLFSATFHNLVLLHDNLLRTSDNAGASIPDGTCDCLVRLFLNAHVWPRGSDPGHPSPLRFRIRSARDVRVIDSAILNRPNGHTSKTLSGNPE